MKGIIFTEFFRLVEQAFGLDMVDDLIEECDLPSGGAYTAVGTYDHTEIAALVTKLSEKTDTPVPDLLKTYGTFLAGRFSELYPQFFKDSDNAFDFLESVETYIHVEVRKLYENAQLPSFDTRREGEDTLVMVYRSDRHLHDVAEGLIIGTLDYFKEECDLTSAPEGDGVAFTIRRLS